MRQIADSRATSERIEVRGLALTLLIGARFRRSTLPVSRVFDVAELSLSKRGTVTPRFDPVGAAIKMEIVMSIIDQALKANERYAQTYDPKWGRTSAAENCGGDLIGSSVSDLPEFSD